MSSSAKSLVLPLLTSGFLLTSGWLLTSGCVGDIGGAPEELDGTTSDPASCSEAPSPGPAPIRRMTRFEYNQTVRDLLGDTTNPADNFGAEEEALGFNNNAANLVTSSTLAEKYMLAAEDIAARAVEPIAKNLPCDPADTGEAACAAQFIDDFGGRAFRRPLTDEERAMFLSLYEVGRADDGFSLGIQLVIQAALQSPTFLYRVEFGQVGGDGDGDGEDGNSQAVRLDHFEMASRLSYFLWGTMPDDALFDAASSGKLGSDEEIEQQARRMVDDPKARHAVEQFHVQWLDYDRISSVGKDVGLFPEYSGELGQLMEEETRLFIEQAVFEDAGDLTTLLTAPYSYMNAELAAFYGAEAPSGESFARVELDPSVRAGLLTTGSLLTINAHSNQTSPVHRGKLVREQFLCNLMPPPPPDVMITVPEPDPTSSARERFAQHSEDPACNGCHVLMDPIGFGFESFDAIGRFRTEENGAAIDSSGELTNADVAGTFEGVSELAGMLSNSAEVEACYRTQWFRYAYGRGELVDDDQCSLDQLDQALSASGGNVRELLVALTQTDTFLYRPRITAELAEGESP